MIPPKLFSETWYERSARVSAAFDALDGDREVATLVVGGGFAGLATIHGLLDRGHGPVALLEAGSIGSGASGRNGGFCSAGFPLPMSRVERRVGEVAAKELFALTRSAVGLVRERIASASIPCDPVDGILEASWFERRDELRAEGETTNARYGTRYRFVPREELRDLYRTERYTDGLLDPDGLHLHPLDLARGLARLAAERGVSIFEHSPLTALRRDGATWNASTAKGRVRARHVVMAASAGQRLPVSAARRGVLPVMTYILVTEPLGARLAEIVRAPWAVHDDRFATGYWRPLPDGRLLWGGRIGLLERPPGLRHELLHDLARVFPQLSGVRIEYLWSGRMGFSRHKMPLVGPLEPDLWLASAFGGHGLGTTTMAGEMVAAAIAGGDDRWRLLEPFGRPWVGGPAGLVAAQAIYAWMGLRDRVRLARDPGRHARASRGRRRTP